MANTNKGMYHHAEMERMVNFIKTSADVDDLKTIVAALQERSKKPLNIRPGQSYGTTLTVKDGFNFGCGMYLVGLAAALIVSVFLGLISIIIGGGFLSALFSLAQ